MDKRQAILQFIAEYRDQHGYPPTVREIGPVIGTESTGQVHYYLDALVRERLIYRTPGIARGLRVSGEGRALLGEPVQKGA